MEIKLFLGVGTVDVAAVQQSPAAPAGNNKTTSVQIF